MQSLGCEHSLMLLNLGIIQVRSWSRTFSDARVQHKCTGRRKVSVHTRIYWYPKSNQRGKALIELSTLALLPRAGDRLHAALQTRASKRRPNMQCISDVLHLSTLSPWHPSGLCRRAACSRHGNAVPCASCLTLQMCSMAAIMAK